ncbi:hypothetical protein [Kitasatospora sp. NPDC051914]|uniref:hypothetical protein n=1 Tax=Kitasatospora sp. NPDC051914 TaxID=3154945 RepID=UPI003448F9D7
MGGSIERRPTGLVPWGVAAGAAAWCLVGWLRSERTENDPWNVWIPIGYGAVKGVLLGLLAGWCAVAAVRLARGRGGGGVAFAGALAGGLLLGTLRDFLGDPQPRTLYYFDDPRPEAEWYWRPLLAEWGTYTVLPALLCALVVLFAARSPRWAAGGTVALALTGAALLFLPFVAAHGLPEPEGNGEHVNKSAAATLTVLATALGVLAGAAVLAGRARAARMSSRRSGG